MIRDIIDQLWSMKALVEFSILAFFIIITIAAVAAVIDEARK